MADFGRGLKRVLVGKPIPSSEEHRTRLSKLVALPVFSSDAISSTAYATEEILIVLVGAAGLSLLHLSIWVGAAVAGLLVDRGLLVSADHPRLSFRRRLVHRQQREPGPAAGHDRGGFADDRLRHDRRGQRRLGRGGRDVAAFPSLYPYQLIISLVVVAVVALANLRGLEESGTIFAAPTYAFILLCGGLVVVGIARWAMGDLHPLPHAAVAQQQQLTSIALVFVLLRAFSGGCSAMTGTEAISNGVPAFRPPESRNAVITLGVMATILGVFLVGVTALSQVLHLIPNDTDTILSQVARAVYGSNSFLYYALQVSTMAILFLAANTSFADFPRLSSILARDGLMPRQFMNRGDKLAFSNGIIGLAVLSMIILAIFNATTNSMIPLYAVGVFVSFTLSQSGMVVHWFRLKTDGLAATCGHERFRCGLHWRSSRWWCSRPSSRRALTSCSSAASSWC